MLHSLTALTHPPPVMSSMQLWAGGPQWALPGLPERLSVFSYFLSGC